MARTGHIGRDGEFLQQPESARLGDSGRSRRRVQLRESIRDVPVYGVLAHDQAGGDLPVREPLGEQPEDLPLPRRELRQRSGLRDAPVQELPRPLGQRQVMIGRLLTATISGNLLGAAISGVVSDVLHWSSMFIGLGVISLVGMLLGIYGLRGLPRGESHPLDLRLLRLGNGSKPSLRRGRAQAWAHPCRRAHRPRLWRRQPWSHGRDRPRGAR